MFDVNVDSMCDVFKFVEGSINISYFVGFQKFSFDQLKFFYQLRVDEIFCGSTVK